jgi:hypothetical protein
MDDSAPGTPDETGHEPPSAGRRIVLGAGFAVLVAVISWLFGHLPWVLSGFSWPTTAAVPVGSSSEGLSGVRLTIPLVAAFLPSLIAFTTIGAVAASLLPLVLTTKAGRRRPAVLVALASSALTTVVVTLLARRTIREHASDAFAGDSRVLLGLVVVVLATAVAGALAGTLASLQVGFLPVAAALAAGQLSVWVESFLIGRGPSIDTTRTVGQVAHVLVFVVLTVAFVLSVRRTAAWVALWPVAIALVWVAVPFHVMTINLAGQLRPSAGLPGSLPDILRGAVDVFRASFWQAPQARWPWEAAVLVALAWMAVERGIRRRGLVPRR